MNDIIEYLKERLSTEGMTQIKNSYCYVTAIKTIKGMFYAAKNAAILAAGDYAIEALTTFELDSNEKIAVFFSVWLIPTVTNWWKEYKNGQ